MKKLLFLGSAVLILCFGCKIDQSGKTADLIDLHIAIDSGEFSGSRTIGPGSSFSVASVVLNGTGPDGSTFSVSTSEDSCEADGLLPGDWTVQAAGYSSDNILLASGETTVTLKKNSTSVQIDLSPIQGDGTLNVALTWEGLYVLDPSVQAKLVPAGGGDAVPVPVDIQDAQALLQGTFPSGLYQLQVELNDGSDQVSGFSEVVCICADQTSEGSIDLPVDEYTLAGDISLQDNTFHEIPVSLVGLNSLYYDDRPYEFSAVVPDSQTPRDVSWYLDGTLLGTGSSFTGTIPKGRHRLDVNVFSSDLLSAGSAGSVCSSYDSVYAGSMLFAGSYQDGTDGCDGLSGVRSCAISSDGSVMVTAGYGEDKIGLFRIAPETGDCSFLGVYKELGGQSCEKVVSVLPAGNDFFFALSKTGQECLWLRYNPDSFGLDFIASIPLSGSPSSVCLSPDGAFLYVTEPDTDTIEIFSINSDTESVTPVEQFNTEEASAFAFSAPNMSTASPNGNWIAVTSYSGDCLCLFSRNPSDGTVTSAAIFDENLNGASGIAFTPDSASCYVAGYYENSVNLYSLNNDGSSWRFTQSYAGFDNPRGLLLSLDGTELYVFSSGSDSLDVCSRCPDPEGINLEGKAVNNTGAVAGLDGIRSGAVSSDGKCLYTCASNDNAVALFRRD